MEKWSVLGLVKAKYKLRLEFLMSEIKKALKDQGGCVKGTQGPA